MRYNGPVRTASALTQRVHGLAENLRWPALRFDGGGVTVALTFCGLCWRSRSRRARCAIERAFGAVLG